MASEQQHFAAARQYQEYYQTAVNSVGARIPAPTLGMKVNDYRREMLRHLKRTFLPQNHELYQIQMRGLEPNVLDVFEPQVLQAAVKEAVNPAHVPPGEIRKIERLDDTGRVRFIDWVGQESFVKQMMRPGRRVVSFTTDRGRYDAMKGRYF